MMSLKAKYCFIVLLTGTFFILSCKKEKSCEGCKENNKPPTAIAGTHQVITLPTDSIYWMAQPPEIRMEQLVNDHGQKFRALLLLIFSTYISLAEGK